MIALKLTLMISTLITASEAAMLIAEMGDTNSLLLISSIITAIFGGIVLVITTRSNTKINEMKVASELEKVKREGEMKLQQQQLETQKALSMVNAGHLNSLRTEVAVNTAETIKSAARVEQLEQKLPIPRGEADGQPIDVHVTNNPSDPVPIKPA